jgi:hypothetical protein
MTLEESTSWIWIFLCENLLFFFSFATFEKERKVKEKRRVENCDTRPDFSQEISTIIWKFFKRNHVNFLINFITFFNTFFLFIYNSFECIHVE